MSELIRSIERSVTYLKGSYPENLPLLVSLEVKLDYLKAKKGSPAKQAPLGTATD